MLTCGNPAFRRDVPSHSLSARRGLQPPGGLDTWRYPHAGTPSTAQLLTKVDDLTDRLGDLVAEVREVTGQLEPERARSTRNAITMAAVMIDEIRLRAHARPLDEPPGEIAK
jgi:hypothetical protein